MRIVQSAPSFRLALDVRRLAAGFPAVLLFAGFLLVAAMFFILLRRKFKKKTVLLPCSSPPHGCTVFSPSGGQHILPLQAGKGVFRFLLLSLRL